MDKEKTLSGEFPSAADRAGSGQDGDLCEGETRQQTNSPSVIVEFRPIIFHNEEVQMSQTKRRILFRPASVLLLGALAMLLAQSVAHAEILSISGGDLEVIGDPGGTSFSNTTGSAGQGLPTALGGWPNNPPGFAPDPSFNNALGISGFKNISSAGISPLTVSLDQAGPVTFTFFGTGNATASNSFELNGQTLFTSSSSQGDTAVVNLPAGALNFSWTAGTTPQTTVSNSSLSPEGTPGFFAGVDPYTATDQFQRTSVLGGSVFVGLTDRIVPSPGQSDHDFQDLSVRITAVPEPASLITGTTAALIIGLGYAWSRRRKRASA